MESTTQSSTQSSLISDLSDICEGLDSDDARRKTTIADHSSVLEKVDRDLDANFELELFAPKQDAASENSKLAIDSLTRELRDSLIQCLEMTLEDQQQEPSVMGSGSAHAASLSEDEIAAILEQVIDPVESMLHKKLQNL